MCGFVARVYASSSTIPVNTFLRARGDYRVAVGNQHQRQLGPTDVPGAGCDRAKDRGRDPRDLHRHQPERYCNGRVSSRCSARPSVRPRRLRSLGWNRHWAFDVRRQSRDRPEPRPSPALDHHFWRGRAFCCRHAVLSFGCTRRCRRGIGGYRQRLSPRRSGVGEEAHGRRERNLHAAQRRPHRARQCGAHRRPQAHACDHERHGWIQGQRSAVAAPPAVTTAASIRPTARP